MRKRARRFGWLGGGGVLLLVVLYVLGKPPLLEGYGFSGAVSDRQHVLMRLSLAPDQRYRLPIALDQIAPVAIESAFLYEDRWFYRHPGVNPWALVKAGLHSLKGGSSRGASTLTMQVARLRFGIQSNTIPGKLVQILRALQLEVYYSKSEILTAYFTLAPYGGNIEGIAAASRIYFDKEPAALSLAESLALAVMPQRPAQNTPTLEGHEPEAMRAARLRLARAYLAQHPESSEAEVGIARPLPLRRRDALPFSAPHVAMRMGGGGMVVTTLDLTLQRLVERRASDYLRRSRESGITNLSVMLVDDRSMEVLASLGSGNFNDASISGQVDGTTAKRSPGSALKPFVYALALEEGLIHPKTLLKDAPMRFGGYHPENFDGVFEGPLSATAALTHSRNLPAVFLESELLRRAQEQGRERGGLYSFLKRAEVRAPFPASHYGLSIVLGSLEVTMEELVRLYAMLGRYGNLAPLRYRLDSRPATGEQILSPEAAQLTLEMLRADEAALGAGGAAGLRDRTPVAWKTGTSYGFRDAWTVGVVGPYVLAVWVGNFDSRGNAAFVGRRAAAPLFFELIEALRPRLQAEPPVSPPATRVQEIEVCSVSGQIPTPFCPHTQKTHFIPGVSPITPCELHREIAIERSTGLRACPGETTGTIARVFEFWPTDMLRLFDQAGLPRKRPPPYAPSCGLGERATQGRPPLITSPQARLVYTLRARELGSQAIPLTAIAEGDVTRLSWFAGDRFLGTASRNEPFLWKAEPGEFVIRVVDDNGRSGARAVKVALVE